MEYSFAFLVALTTCVTQAVKALKFPTAYLPFIAMIIGTLFSFLGGTAVTISQTILDGIIIGLAGAGLFDFAKLTIGKGILKIK